ncbi:MAG: hypothetical protein ABII21_02595 [bacterium]
MKKLLFLLGSSIWFLNSSIPLAHADWLIDRSGTLVQINGSVLGDETPDTTNTTARQKLEQQTSQRASIQAKTGQTSTLDLHTGNGKLELNQEIRPTTGPAVRRPPLAIKEGESLYVEQEDGVKARINATKDGRMELTKNRIKTNSEFQFKVGEKNEISVTLPNGKEREVTLPDQALANLISRGILTATDGVGGTTDYELTAGTNGEPVYPVEGKVEKKLFGLPFLKYQFAQKLEVAASTSEDGTIQAGDIVESQSQETSPWRRLLERLSR